MKTDCMTDFREDTTEAHYYFEQTYIREIQVRVT